MERGRGEAKDFESYQSYTLIGEMMTQVPEAKIYFSREQVEYIQKIFPEVVPTRESSLSDVMLQAGKRHVANFLKDRMK